MKWTVLVLSAVLQLHGLAWAQTPVVKGEKPLTGTFTIQAIDQTNRIVTLRNDKGVEEPFLAGPDVKRFSELKVGQKVQMSYYESLVVDIAQAGATTKPMSETSAVTPGTGSLPGGTVARQVKATVEVVAVDAAVPSITIKTASGATITRKLQDKADLTGVKAGQKIDITYTEAAVVQVMN